MTWCKMTKDIKISVDLAAKHGHLDCLKYLHEDVGAKYTEWAMIWAAQKGHLRCLKYLHETIGAECTYYTYYLCNCNCSLDNLECVKYIKLHIHK